MLFGLDPAASASRQALLVRRAGLRVQSPELALSPPEAQRPERGHGTLRAGLGGGVAQEAGAGQPVGATALLDLRLCLHDLLDPPDGYLPHAQIEFLRLRLRWDQRASRLELDDGALLDITSLSPVSRFDLRPSWRLQAGATTVRDGGCDRCTAAQLGVGGGLAASAAGGALDAALFGDLELIGSAHLDGFGGGPVRLGLGPGGLVRARLGDRFALLASGSWRWLPEAQPRETWGLDLSARVHASRRVSVGLEARQRPGERSAGLVVYLFDGL
jgi:hypothetical protein